MPVTAELQYRGGSPKKVMRKAVIAAKDGILDATRLWHRHYLPLHFSFAAHRRYDYTPRSKKYEIRRRSVQRT